MKKLNIMSDMFSCSFTLSSDIQCITQVKKYDPILAEKHRNLEAAFLPESHRKMPEIFRSEHCFHFALIPEGFLQDLVTFPPLSRGICSLRVAGMIDVGKYLFE